MFTCPSGFCGKNFRPTLGEENIFKNEDCGRPCVVRLDDEYFVVFYIREDSSGNHSWNNEKFQIGDLVGRVGRIIGESTISWVTSEQLIDGFSLNSRYCSGIPICADSKSSDEVFILYFRQDTATELNNCWGGDGSVGGWDVECQAVVAVLDINTGTGAISIAADYVDLSSGGGGGEGDNDSMGRWFYVGPINEYGSGFNCHLTALQDDVFIIGWIIHTSLAGQTTLADSDGKGCVQVFEWSGSALTYLEKDVWRGTSNRSQYETYLRIDNRYFILCCLSKGGSDTYIRGAKYQWSHNTPRSFDTGSLVRIINQSRSASTVESCGGEPCMSHWLNHMCYLKEHSSTSGTHYFLVLMLKTNINLFDSGVQLCKMVNVPDSKVVAAVGSVATWIGTTSGDGDSAEMVHDSRAAKITALSETQFLISWLHNTSKNGHAIIGTITDMEGTPSFSFGGIFTFSGELDESSPETGTGNHWPLGITTIKKHASDWKAIIAYRDASDSGKGKVKLIYNKT